MTTIATLRDAVKRCSESAFKDHPYHTDARLHSFVARLSGSMEHLGERELDETFWGVLETVSAPAQTTATAGG